MRDEVDAAARETIAAMKSHHQDWFDENDAEIKELLTEKYNAHKVWLADRQSDAKRIQFNAKRRTLQKRLHEE